MEQHTKKQVAQADLRSPLGKVRKLSFLSILISLLSLNPLKSEYGYAAEAKKTVAITQIVAHPSLNMAKEGILSALKQNGFEVGKNLTVLNESAQGDIAQASMIAKKFVSLKPDVIIPISTPSAQTVLKAAQGSKIPVVFSSVSDPVAAGLVKDLRERNGEIVGVTDTPAISEAVGMMKTLLPNLKKLGLLYNAAESNSVRAIQLLKEHVGSSLTLTEATVPSSMMLADAFRSLVNKKVQAIFIPMDNTVNSAITQIIKLALENSIPLFSCDPINVEMGAFACFGSSQFSVGEKTGELVARILKGEKLENLRVETPDHATVFVNRSTAKKLGIQIPSLFKGEKIQYYD